MHWAHTGGTIKIFRFFFSYESSAKKYHLYDRKAGDELQKLVSRVKTPTEIHRRLTHIKSPETKSSGYQVKLSGKQCVYRCYFLSSYYRFSTRS